MSISTTRINIHVIYIYHVYDKNVKNSQDVDSFDLLWINRHRELIQLSIYITLVLFSSISKFSSRCVICIKRIIIKNQLTYKDFDSYCIVVSFVYKVTS